MPLDYIVYGSVAICVAGIFYVIVSFVRISIENKSVPEGTYEAAKWQDRLDRTPDHLPEIPKTTDLLGLESGEPESSPEEKVAVAGRLDTEIERMKNEFLRMKEEGRYSEGLLTSVSSERDSLLASFSEKIKEARTPLLNEIEMQKKEQSRLMDQKREAEKRSAEYERQVVSVMAELEGTKDALEANRKQLGLERVSFEKLASVSKDKDNTIDDLSKKIMAGKTELKNKEGELETNKMRLEEERASLGRLISACKDKDVIIEGLSKKVASVTKDLSRLHEEKAFLQHAIDFSRKELYDVKTSIPKEVSQAKGILQKIINTLNTDREDLLKEASEIDRQLVAESKGVVDHAKESK
ncbi:hypothetical protein OAA99_00990 [Omnitrophica bacterium]|nr:hypothetical protein [Candidatus Omnitrophota bacterium]